MRPVVVGSGDVARTGSSSSRLARSVMVVQAVVDAGSESEVRESSQVARTNRSPSLVTGAPTTATARVLLSAGITLAAALVEFAGARLGRSLFLTADAVHLVAHIAIYAALLMPRRRGGRDAPTIAVLAIVLLIAVVIVATAALDLLRGPDRVAASTLLLSIVGLGANVATAALLSSSARVGLSFRVAFVHELLDGVLTVAALVGAALIALKGWNFVDSALSIALGVWLFVWALGHLGRIARMEYTP